jgi:hypothetical protein
MTTPETKPVKVKKWTTGAETLPHEQALIDEGLFVFRDGYVYNKKTGRQLKRYEREGAPPYFLDPEQGGYALYFKIKGRLIDFNWAKQNLTHIAPTSNGISMTSL